jgi:hypothetical protein
MDTPFSVLVPSFLQKLTYNSTTITINNFWELHHFDAASVLEQERCASGSDPIAEGKLIIQHRSR